MVGIPQNSPEPNKETNDKKPNKEHRSSHTRSSHTALNDLGWDILDTYFRDNKHFVTQHHLNSFDEFITDRIPNIVRSLNPFDMIKFFDNTQTPKLKVDVFVGGKQGTSLRFDRPFIRDANGAMRPLYPNEARLKSITYKSNLYADIVVETTVFNEDGSLGNMQQAVHQNVRIGAIPVMVGSRLCNLHGLDDRSRVLEAGECTFDQGGYFIINGKEKVIIAQERNVTNVLFISSVSDEASPYSYEAVIRCTPEEAAVFPKVVRFYVQKAKAEDAANRHQILVTMPGIEIPIPVFVLFRALGVASDRSILEYILLHNDPDDSDNKMFVDFLYASIVNGRIAHTQQEALEYIGARYKVARSTKVRDRDPDRDADATNTVDVRVVQHMLLVDVFPNMNEVYMNGAGETKERMNVHTKAMFLGHLVMSLMRVCLQFDLESDRDHYEMKRVDVSGALCANLFRDFYNLFRRTCKDEMDRQYYFGPSKQSNAWHRLINVDNLSRFFQPVIVEEHMINSLRGKWGVDEESNGVVQDLSRLSYMGSISHLRRVQSPLSSEIKITAPHRLHASQYGIICPIESPDGANVGLIKNMALTCYVTPEMPGRLIRSWLSGQSSNLFQPLASVVPSTLSMADVGLCKVFVNHNWTGCSSSPNALVSKLRELRRNALQQSGEKRKFQFLSVSWDIVRRKIDIFTDAGRCCRPLLIVKTSSRSSFGELVLTQSMMTKLASKSANWKDVFLENMVEYVDVAESGTCLIAPTGIALAQASALKKVYTHCEIHPSSMFAVLTANIPFANHNPAPRGAFSCAQGKQAIGVYSTQFANRMDTAGLVLHYAQRAVVGTRYMSYLRNNGLPNGENAIVAIMTYSGYNQEDAMIMNKASIERGMFNITYFKTIVADEEMDKHNPGGSRVVFAHPETIEKMEGVRVSGYGVRFANYKHLDVNGFPKLNAKIAEHDAYIGKVLMTPPSTEASSATLTRQKAEETKHSYKDKSHIADKTTGGIVDRVFVFGENGQRKCKIRLRKMRLPTLGDKHASRHAQKGVVGMILPQAQMPFTKEGLVPDIILNPHAFPSRMTVGHVMECVLGKAGCMSGMFYDATPFSFAESNVDDAGERLERAGFQRHGDQVMYSGIDGQQLACDVFIGPTYILRLKHMVDDKINYRVAGDNGGYQAMTRQPVASRAKGGGLRVGEMETNSIIAHGIASMLKESMMDRSDAFMVGLDKTDGDIATTMNLGFEQRRLVGDDASGLVGGTVTSIDRHRQFAMSVSDVRGIDGPPEFCALQMPYSAKLLLHEVRSLGINPILRTVEENETLEDYVGEETETERDENEDE